jgi:putative hydrolase of the HAD superfamily
MKIFFDVDGVLIDGWHAKRERRRLWSTNLTADLGIDRTLFRDFFTTPAGGHPSRMHACMVGARDLKETLGEFLPTIGYTGDVETLVRYWFTQDSKRNLPLFDVIARLRAHADVALYLATGQEHHRAAFLWNELGFKDFFREMFYGAQIGHPKDDPAFFHAINQALQIAPGEHPLFFDDTPEVVAAARTAGWEAVEFDSIDDVLRHPRLARFLAGSNA